MSRKNTPLSVTKKTNASSLFSTPNSRLPTASKVKPGLLKKFSAFESPAVDLNAAFSATKAPGVSTRTPIKSLAKAKSSSSLNVTRTPTATPRTLLSTPKSVKKSMENFQTPESSAKLALYTPKRMAKSSMDVSTLSDKDTHSGEISNLKVAVRVRPMNVKECKNPAVTNVVRVRGNEITVLANASADTFGQSRHCFQYDHAFWSCDTEHPDCADQAAVFEGTALPLVEKAFEGYNCCLFAYGQTGSGKSYSVMGIDLDDNDIDAKTNSEAGIIPRFCQELFGRIKALSKEVHAEVEVSYFEVYNEKIHDLLTVSPASSGTEHGASTAHVKKPALKVREHPVWGPYVSNRGLKATI
jgi:kinesin family member 14